MIMQHSAGTEGEGALCQEWRNGAGRTRDCRSPFVITASTMVQAVSQSGKTHCQPRSGRRPPPARRFQDVLKEIAKKYQFIKDNPVKTLLSLQSPTGIWVADGPGQVAISSLLVPSGREGARSRAAQLRLGPNDAERAEGHAVGPPPGHSRSAGRGAARDPSQVTPERLVLTRRSAGVGAQKAVAVHVAGSLPRFPVPSGKQRGRHGFRMLGTPTVTCVGLRDGFYDRV